MAVKALKTNNPAKWADFAGKDFKGLRPAMRNESFLIAKCVVLASQGFQWVTGWRAKTAVSPCENSVSFSRALGFGREVLSAG
jgi:hypothetical protein